MALDAIIDDSLSLWRRSFFFLFVAAACQASDFRFGSFSSLLGSIRHTFFDANDVLLVLLHIGQDVDVVDGGGTARYWVEEPDEENELEEEVEGDESENKAGELVHDIEESENNPVRQPLLVVVGAL